MSELKLKLGAKVRDKITGFEGIATAKVEYLTGCDQYRITPPIKDGKIQDTQYIDYRRLEVVGAGITAEDVADVNDPGGPNRDAPR